MARVWIAVMAGGALGSGARLWVSGWLAGRYGETFPVGTLVVNITGCLLIGLFMGLTGPDGALLVSPLTRQFVAIGLLGGFTTFSTFSLQTVNLLGDGQWLYALLNIVISLAACLAAVWLGLMLANLLNPE